MKDTALAKRQKAACMSKRRGNPDWGKPMGPMPAGPSEFELTAMKLRLSSSQYVGSSALKNWVRRNKGEKYVPLDLLTAWGFNETTTRQLGPDGTGTRVRIHARTGPPGGNYR